MDGVKFIANSSELEALFFGVEYLGKGGFSCVLKGTYQSMPVVIKVLEEHERNNKSEPYDKDTALREYYIGMKLGKTQVASFFAKSILLISSSDGIPASWVALFGAKGCTIEQPTKPKFIYVQEYANGQSVQSWLGKHNGPVSGDVIRSVAMQTVIALGYAQMELGYQSNDLKMENMLFVDATNSVPMKQRYQFGNDVFEVDIPVGGVHVKIIDYGGASFYADARSERVEFIKTDTMRTVMFQPFECVICEVDYNIRKLRRNHSDYPSIFMILMNMIAHGRAGWTYKDNGDSSENYVDYHGTGILVNRMPTKPPLRMLYDEDNKEYSSGSVSRLLVLVTLYKALGLEIPLITYPNYQKKDGSPNKAADTDGYDNIIYELQAVKQFIRSGGFMNAMDEGDKKSVRPFSTEIPQLLQDCFGEAILSKSFLRLLCSPDPAEREAFGVPEFGHHGLANALYHPFLAAYYWGTSNASGTTTTITYPEMAPPLAHREAALHAALVAEAERFAVEFAQGQAAASKPVTPRPGPAPGPLPGTIPQPQTGPILSIPQDCLDYIAKFQDPSIAAKGQFYYVDGDPDGLIAGATRCIDVAFSMAKTPEHKVILAILNMTLGGKPRQVIPFDVDAPKKKKDDITSSSFGMGYGAYGANNANVFVYVGTAADVGWLALGLHAMLHNAPLAYVNAQKDVIANATGTGLAGTVAAIRDATQKAIAGMTSGGGTVPDPPVTKTTTNNVPTTPSGDDRANTVQLLNKVAKGYLDIMTFKKDGTLPSYKIGEIGTVLTKLWHEIADTYAKGSADLRAAYAKSAVFKGVSDNGLIIEGINARTSKGNDSPIGDAPYLLLKRSGNPQYFNDSMDVVNAMLPFLTLLYDAILYMNKDKRSDEVSSAITSYNSDQTSAKFARDVIAAIAQHGKNL